MSRFRRLSHAIWHCQYHLVWVPKYRHRVLRGDVKREVGTCIHVFSGQKGCEVVEMNVRQDHVHLIVMIPPKVSIRTTWGSSRGGRRSGCSSSFLTFGSVRIGAIISGPRVTALIR